MDNKLDQNRLRVPPPADPEAAFRAMAFYTRQSSVCAHRRQEALDAQGIEQGDAASCVFD